MKLSVQLYTVRDQASADLPATLKTLKDSGLNYVELAGLHGRSASEWKALLDDLGLKVSGSHIGLDQFESRLDELFEENRVLENKYLVIPWIGAADYAGGWAEVADRFAAIGEKVNAAGFVLAYHNHDFEFKNEGKPGLDVLYESASPEALQAQIDAYWVLRGGQDPAAYVRKLKGRVPLVHLKDGTGSGDVKFLPAGEGDIDYVALLAACDEAGVEFGSIELDVSPIPPLEAVAKSVTFLRGKGISE